MSDRYIPRGPFDSEYFITWGIILFLVLLFYIIKWISEQINQAQKEKNEYLEKKRIAWEKLSTLEREDLISKRKKKLYDKILKTLIIIGIIILLVIFMGFCSHLIQIQHDKHREKERTEKENEIKSIKISKYNYAIELQNKKECKYKEFNIQALNSLIRKTNFISEEDKLDLDEKLAKLAEEDKEGFETKIFIFNIDSLKYSYLNSYIPPSILSKNASNTKTIIFIAKSRIKKKLEDYTHSNNNTIRYSYLTEFLDLSDFNNNKLYLILNPISGTYVFEESIFDDNKENPLFIVNSILKHINY
jgi:Na+-transporting methylmalonyl-CoA/oxaloacetate decarboxylase gamma subunit